MEENKKIEELKPLTALVGESVMNEQSKVVESGNRLKDRLARLDFNIQRSKKTMNTTTSEEVLQPTERVHAIDESIGYVSYEMRNRRIFQELYDAYRSRKSGAARAKSIRGIINSAITIEGIPCALVRLGPYRIIIPANLLIENIELRGTEREQLKQLNTQMNNRVDAEIDFYIDRIDEDGMTMLGNRVDWLKAERTRILKEGGFTVGKIVEGRLMAVSTHEATVEVCGMERRLHERDCTYQMTTDLKDYFNDRFAGNGDKPRRVPVRILEFETERKEDGKLSVKRFKVSIKEAESKEHAQIYNSIMINERSSGTITFIDQQGVHVKMNNMNFSITCAPSLDFDTPPIGSKVQFVVTKKFDNGQFVRGRLIAPR